MTKFTLTRMIISMILFIFTFTYCSSNTESTKSTNVDISIQKDNIKDSFTELGQWTVGDYIDDFDKPTGEKFIRLNATGIFANSATAGSELCIKINIEKSNSGYYFTIYCDEYCNGTRDYRLANFSNRDIILGKIINKENKCRYLFGEGYPYLNIHVWDDIEKNSISIIDILKKEIPLDFYFRTKDKVDYKFSIDTRYFNNAIKQANFEN